MLLAQERDSVNKNKFFFKLDGKSDFYTIKDIMSSLLNLVERFILEKVKYDNKEQLAKLYEYISFIEKRSTGEIKTNATEFREFILNHSGYKKDSYVSNEICFDMITKLCL